MIVFGSVIRSISTRAGSRNENSSRGPGAAMADGSRGEERRDPLHEHAEIALAGDRSAGFGSTVTGQVREPVLDCSEPFRVVARKRYDSFEWQHGRDARGNSGAP